MQPQEFPSLSNEDGEGQVPQTQEVTAGGGMDTDVTPVTRDAEIPCLNLRELPLHQKVSQLNFKEGLLDPGSGAE